MVKKKYGLIKNMSKDLNKFHANLKFITKHLRIRLIF